MATKTKTGGVSPRGGLTRLEAELIKAVEAGRDFTYDPKKLGKNDHIRGPFLRSLVLGVAFPPSRTLLANFKPVQVTPHGIRIRRAEDPGIGRPSGKAEPSPLLRIEGDLDLSGLAAPGGGVLPLLELSDCEFAGAISMAGARLQALILKGSRFFHLDASGAHFGGRVSFTDCRPRRQPTDRAEAFFASHELAAFEPDRAGREGTGHAYASRKGHGAGILGALPSDYAPSAEADEDKSLLACTIDLQFATIEGGLALEDCYFRAGGMVGLRSALAKLHDEVAVNLSRAHVGRSVLFKQVMVIGFVKAPSAYVGHDVAVRGGKFLVWTTAPAFDFQLARIGGKLSFQEGRPTQSERAAGIRAFPLIVLGQIWGVGLRAGEVWIGEGLYYASDPEGRGARPTLYFSKADIATTFKIGAYHEFHTLHPRRPTQGAMIQGEICLLAANLGKNLEIHGLHSSGLRAALKLDHPFFNAFGCDRRQEEFVRVTAMGLNVDRRAVLTGTHLRDFTRKSGHSKPLPAKSPGTKSGALDLWKSKIGIGLRISRTCTVQGAIRFNSCVIGREVIIGCKSLQPSPRDPESEAPNIVPWLIDMRESTISGHVKIGRRTFGDPAVKIAGGLTVEDAKVKGRMLLRQVEFDLSQYVAGPDDAEQKYPRHRVALNMRDFECGSDLEVHGLTWKLPLATSESLPLRGLRGGRKLWQRLNPEMRLGFHDITKGWFAIVDLRGLRCGLMIDSSGDGWGLEHRLRLLLAGIRVSETEAGEQRGARRRLAWLSFQSRQQSPRCHGRRDPDEEAKAGAVCSYVGASPLDFVPQAYDAFARVSRRAGNVVAAETIVLEKKNIANYIRLKTTLPHIIWGGRGRRIRQVILAFVGLALLVLSPWSPTFLGILAIGSVIYLWPLVHAGFQSLFRGLFRYGLSPDRALLVLAVCILIGWGGVYIARSGLLEPQERLLAVDGRLHPRIALVLEVPYQPSPDHSPPPLAKADLPKSAPGAATPAGHSPARQPQLHSGSAPHAPSHGDQYRIHTKALIAQPSPCDLAVSSLLYAMDVFIPVLDLDQEERCSIREDDISDGKDNYLIWRWIKAIYEILGWIVTSLVILTVTGVLRRDLEPAQDLPSVELGT
ncbi:MAG TPA: hypothetical protein VF650_14430 [Allosphingosinicella sp.]|jgi:hypothetical protein